MKGRGLKLSAIGRGTIPEEERQVSSPTRPNASQFCSCLYAGVFDQNVQTRFIPVAHPIIQARGVIGCGCLSLQLILAGAVAARRPSLAKAAAQSAKCDSQRCSLMSEGMQQQRYCLQLVESRGQK